MDHEILELVRTYGYLAVFIGAVLEGELIIVFAGFLAHESYLELPLVIAFACAGSILWDAAWFFLGRYRGERILARFPKFRRFADVPLEILGKNLILVTFLMRFMYGLRHIVPFSIGNGGLAPNKFLLWNALGGLLWVVVYSGAGYFLANVLEAIFDRLPRYEILLISLAVFLFLLFAAISRYSKYFLKKTVEKKVERKIGAQS